VLSKLTKEARVEHVIATILRRYETGGLTRRELIQGLAVLAGTATTASAAAGQSATAGFQASSLHHIQINVSNFQRSIDFYQKVLGLSLIQRQEKLALLGSGGTLMVSLRPKTPAGVVDHFGVGIIGATQESITRDIIARGATPIDQKPEDGDAGFHVPDPDGTRVQLMPLNPRPNR
jgi:catechol 2,3-dioxygenase-like lactoylglutathione lyase family enzyme